MKPSDQTLASGRRTSAGPNIRDPRLAGRGAGRRRPNPETELGDGYCGEIQRFQRLGVERSANAPLRNPAQRSRHHIGVYQNHSRSTGRPGVLSRCAKPANSSSVSPTRRPTAVSSVPNAARPSAKTVSYDGCPASFRMARTSASVLRPLRGGPHPQGAMHLVGHLPLGVGIIETPLRSGGRREVSPWSALRSFSAGSR